MLRGPAVTRGTPWRGWRLAGGGCEGWRRLTFGSGLREQRGRAGKFPCPSVPRTLRVPNHSRGGAVASRHGTRGGCRCCQLLLCLSKPSLGGQQCQRRMTGETEARGLPKWVTVLQRADLEWENGCSAAAHLCWKSRLVLVARGVSPHLGHGEVVWGHGHPWVIPGWVPRAVQLQMLHVPSMAWGQPGGQ